MAVGFDVTEFDKFTKQLIAMAEKDMPKKLNSFINKESGKLTTRTKKEVKAAVDIKTGNYQKSVEKIKRAKKAKKYYTGGTVSAARHAHLIEHGHNQVIGRGPRKGEKVGVVAGRNVFKAAADDFQSVFNRDLEKLTDEIAKEAAK